MEYVTEESSSNTGEEASNGNQLSTALTAFKLILGNPLARALIKPSLKKYKINDRELPALYWALSIYAGESIKCPLMVRFQADVIKLLLKMGIKIARGDEEAVKEALLRDPHIRRGSGWSSRA